MTNALFWFKRIAVDRTAFWTDDLAEDPRKATRPPVFLKLVQRENREVEQQDHLDIPQVTEKCAHDGDGPE